MTHRVIKAALTGRLAAEQWLGDRTKRNERGSVTIEHILWAIAVITIVGIAVAAIRAYADDHVGLIK